MKAAKPIPWNRWPRLSTAIALARPVYGFVGAAAAALAVWQLIVLAMGLPEFILPSPLSVLAYSLGNLDVLAVNAVVTGWVIVLGFSAAVVVGLGLAFAMTYSPLAEKTIFPLLIVIRTIPTLALAPLFLLLFGFGLLPKVLVVFLIAFFPIVVSTSVGLKSVPLELLALVRSMGGGWLVMIQKVSWPHALPEVFAGVKLGATLSVTGAIVAEFVGSSSGLGHLVVSGLSRQDARLVYAGVLSIVLVGVLVFVLVDRAERLAVPWQRERERVLHPDP